MGVDVVVDAHYYHRPTPPSRGGIEEIPFEYMGVLNLSITFLIIQFFLFIFMGLVMKSLVQIQRDHHTARLMIITVVLYLLRYFFSFLFWLIFHTSGVPQLALDVISNIFLITAMTCYIAMLGLLGSGWSVTVRKLHLLTRMRLTFFVVAFFTLSIGAVAWKAMEDPENSSFFFYSPPGYRIRVTTMPPPPSSSSSSSSSSSFSSFYSMIVLALFFLE